MTLDAEEVEKLAKDDPEIGDDPASWPDDPKINRMINAHVERINEKFARVEQVKKIKVLPQDLSQEGGELTPTLKVKRNVVAEKYGGEIEALYEG